MILFTSKNDENTSINIEAFTQTNELFTSGDVSPTCPMPNLWTIRNFAQRLTFNISQKRSFSSKYTYKTFVKLFLTHSTVCFILNYPIYNYLECLNQNFVAGKKISSPSSMFLSCDCHVTGVNVNKPLKNDNMKVLLSVLIACFFATVLGTNVLIIIG